LVWLAVARFPANFFAAGFVVSAAVVSGWDDPLCAPDLTGTFGAAGWGAARCVAGFAAVVAGAGGFAAAGCGDRAAEAARGVHSNAAASRSGFRFMGIPRYVEAETRICEMLTQARRGCNA
jgi:hypothetical protein